MNSDDLLDRIEALLNRQPDADQRTLSRLHAEAPDVLAEVLDLEDLFQREAC